MNKKVNLTEIASLQLCYY